MEITVELIGVLRRGRFEAEQRCYRSPFPVSQLVEELDLPQPLLGIILINGLHATLDARLSDGDRVTLLPLLDGG
ncbi:MAG: molybdopterin synthase sulfur carrier subunit [Desulfuromonas sp.]|nr:MAG: molybdopterin synthase sulfur carrier subunit [Desulfuromonas sp.]